MKKTAYISDISCLKNSLGYYLDADLSNDDLKHQISNLFYKTSSQISSIEEKDLCDWLFTSAGLLNYGSQYYEDSRKYKDYLISLVMQLNDILPPETLENISDNEF